VINLGILGRRIFLNRLAASVGHADPSYDAQFLDDAVAAFTDYENNYIKEIVGLMEQTGKPVVGVSLLTDDKDATVYRVKGHELKGVFFETPERAVKAAARMVEYRQFLSRHGE
jgi:acyl-CoA synthetase (NDP forming)